MRSDEELVQGCLRGQVSAERELFERFAGKMAAVCRRYSPSQEDTQDLLQEGFIRTFDRLKQWKGGSLEGWVRRIFVSNCLNAYHKRRRRLDVIESQPETPYDAPADDTFYDFLATDAIQIAIAELPDGARIIFNLFAIEGFPHTEIAEMLNITEGACRSQLTRARKLLQARLALSPASNATPTDKP